MESTPTKEFIYSTKEINDLLELETPVGGLPPIPDSPAKTDPDPTKVDLATATVEELDG